MKRIIYILITLTIVQVCHAQTEWEQIANYGGSPTDGNVSFTIDGKGYCGAGVQSKAFWEYNPENNTWTQKANIGGGVNRGWAFGFTINGKGYIGGGDKTGNFNLTADFQEYDPDSDTWTQKASYGGGPRDGAFSCSFNGKGYVFCGFDGTYTTRDVWEYDPNEDTWTQKANYPGNYTIFPVGFIIGAKIYLGTGSVNGMAGKNDFWEYDPATDTYTQKAQFSGAARQAAVAFAVNGKGYLGGGEVNYSTDFDDFYEYDPLTDTWIYIPELDFPSNGATAWSTSFVIGSGAYVGMGVFLPSFSFSNNFFQTTFSITGINTEPGISRHKKIKLYPNPSNGEIKILSPENEQPVFLTVFNHTGDKVLSSEIQNDILNLTSLPRGTYLVNIIFQNPDELVSRKIIIQ